MMSISCLHELIGAQRNSRIAERPVAVEHPSADRTASRAYCFNTPQAMRSPALPEGWLI